jgi:hypothetical protein
MYKGLLYKSATRPLDCSVPEWKPARVNKDRVLPEDLEVKTLLRPVGDNK